LALASAFATTAAASTALVQNLADNRWAQQVVHTGNVNPIAQEHLARALGLGAATMLMQSVASGIDVFFFGWSALGAYRAGDLDTAVVHASLAGASLAYARVSLEAVRALRIARTAVLAGDAQALA